MQRRRHTPATSASKSYFRFFYRVYKHNTEFRVLPYKRLAIVHGTRELIHLTRQKSVWPTPRTKSGHMPKQNVDRPSRPPPARPERAKRMLASSIISYESVLKDRFLEFDTSGSHHVRWTPVLENQHTRPTYQKAAVMTYLGVSCIVLKSVLCRVIRLDHQDSERRQ